MSTTTTIASQAAGAIIDLQFVLPDGNANALPSYGNCKRVKLIAPVDGDGAGTNAAIVNYGDAGNQRDWLAIDGTRDAYVHVDNPSLIYVKGTTGDKVNYRLEL
jgi:hypothetical protein